MASLVLLTATARARIVAPDLFAPNDFVGLLQRASSNHLHFGLLTPLATLVLPNHFLLFFGRSHQEEVAERLVLDAVHQGLKHVEGLPLALHQRITLAVPAPPHPPLAPVPPHHLVLPRP